MSGSPPAWASEWGDDVYGVFAGFTVEGVTQRLRWIPPGRFLMGSPEDEEGRWDDEGPRHEVTLSSGFWLAEMPCTQALWETVTGENPSRFQSPARPVELVSFEDIERFLGGLEERVPGLAPRLPSEAEWEYACRAGTTSSRYDEDLDAIAWHSGNSGGETHDVGGKLANAWGLHDMLGNVWEWCADGMRKYTAALMTDPVGPAGPRRVCRGGSWARGARLARAASRCAWHGQHVRLGLLGFRLARGQGALGRVS
jgi:formylglycine-generating enzyme required for sulfatase activity